MFILRSSYKNTLFLLLLFFFLNGVFARHFVKDIFRRTEVWFVAHFDKFFRFFWTFFCHFRFRGVYARKGDPMEHVGSNKQRKWVVDSQKCSVFSLKSLLTYEICVNSCTLDFHFFAQIALKQRIDFKHCLSSAGITCKSFFPFEKIVRFQLHWKLIAPVYQVDN